MKHLAAPDFWRLLDELPDEVQNLARENFEVLKSNPRHPSLHLKRVNGRWSVRIGRSYRALGIDVDGGILWVWIGPHAAYDRLV